MSIAGLHYFSKPFSLPDSIYTVTVNKKELICSSLMAPKKLYLILLIINCFQHFFNLLLDFRYFFLRFLFNNRFFNP
ncbi:hypothetical protein AB7M70_011853 [Bradyrhizobium japonicum]